MKAKNVSSDIKYKRLIEPSRIHPINSYIFLLRGQSKNNVKDREESFNIVVKTCALSLVKGIIGIHKFTGSSDTSAINR